MEDNMRKINLTTIVLLVFVITVLPCSSAEIEKKTITLSGAWAIYPTAVAWADAFQKKNPDIKIDISAGGAGKGAADTIAGLVDIGMVSREPDPAEIEKGIIPIYILHDAVFPIVSIKNPNIQKIINEGMKKVDFQKLYLSETGANWSDIYKNGLNKKVHVYTRSDSCGAAAAWASYLGKKQEDLKGIGVYGDPGLIEAVKRDPLAIGYTNFGYVYDRSGKVISGIKIVPIDINEDGKIDAWEKCNDRENAIKIINEGKYPASRKNYFFVKGKPSGAVKRFIEFALSDEGSAIVNEIGTSIPISKEERMQILKKIQ
jgi:phosphate transport system substrate-binding protein